MKIAQAFAVLALWLLSCASVSAAPLCKDVVFEGNSFGICDIDLRQVRISLHLRDESGAPYMFPSRLRAALEAQGQQVLAIMNAGMFEADLSPVGLYLERGRLLKAANRRNGPGNFHLKPNGIFFFSGGRAGVSETGAYDTHRRWPEESGTQSGPMLVINGRLHPRFDQDGESRKTRNGVGVRQDGTVVFAVSRSGVSFGTFARLFRDQMNTPNALFLDGSVSVLSGEGIGTVGGFPPMPIGPMLAVTRGR
jgi:uncharacterized protein YigE (DUF2233 family)